MLDTYQPEPFDGAERLRKFCSTVDETPANIPKPRYDVQTVVPRSGLFDIYKRTTDLTVNKCIAIGFTYSDAVEFVSKRLKTKVDEDDKVITFYDIIEQGNELAKNPLWNPEQFTKEDN